MPQSDRFRPAPVALLFVALTVVVTWPQAASLTSQVAAHFDAYFSLWRISWIAHQLPRAPWDLFHANIFYPQQYTLAFSDPVLLEGVSAAPLLWLGVSPILVYNLLVLVSFVLCGTAAAALGYRLTRSHAAGIIAGTIFAFAPYRFEHYFHLEILWAFWMPVAMLALHRAIDTGALRDGCRTGLAVVGQLLSSLYYALYLGAALVVAAPFLIRWQRPAATRAIRALAAGAALAAVVALAYVQPLLRIREEVADRTITEAEIYSATFRSYLSSPPSNRLYGWTSDLGGPELRLFPGLVALGLAAAALWRPRRKTWAYLAILVFAFVASLGVNAPLFGALRATLDPYGMVRVPARFGAVVLLALGALAAIGAARLLSGIGSPRRRWVAAILTSLMVVEYASAPELMTIQASAPPAYRWLMDQPRGVLVELPLPGLGALPGDDPERQYYSTVHWMPLMNGYSGYYPQSYLSLLFYLQVFPRGGWVELLVNRGADYIFIHERGLEPDVLQVALERAELNPLIVRVGRFPHVDDAVWVYRKREGQSGTAGREVR